MILAVDSFNDSVDLFLIDGQICALVDFIQGETYLKLLIQTHRANRTYFWCFFSSSSKIDSLSRIGIVFWQENGAGAIGLDKGFEGK